jgi:D-threo-aldose 1-dehydrogenase
MSSSFIGQRGGFLYGEGAGPGLGFGCAGLMRSPSRRHRQRLLGEAFDRGVRHFDVARMYGMGAAEGELGRFARGRRGQISIATKFGIEPGRAGRLASLQAPARAAVARFPALRAALKRRDGAFHEPRRYDVAAARASLETSLGELGTDYVDFFFVHDPQPDDLVEIAALEGAMEELRAAGKIRAWGLSGEQRPCLELHDEAGAGAVLQVHDDIFSPAPGQPGGSPTIGFGVVAGALRRIEAHLAAAPERRTAWSRALGVDCCDSEVIASLLLQDALDRHAAGGALFSTGRLERVRAAGAAADLLARADGEPEALRAFRERVRAELGAAAVAGV